MTEVQIDEIAGVLADLKRRWSSTTVPSHIYTDPVIHQAERERIFETSWQFLAHESEIPDPGDFVVRYMLEDSVIVCRGQDGVVRAMHNVCRHRGMQVCRADLGNTSRFTCPYHGWLYDTSGALTSVPMDRPYFGPDGVDREAHSLVPVTRCSVFDGLIFGCSAADTPPLEEFLDDYRWYLELYTRRDPAGLQVIGEPQRWRVRANWKTGAENFMGDSYHAQYTHRSVFLIGLHPNQAGDFSAGGKRNGIHVDAGPGTVALARQSGSERGYPQDLLEMIRSNLPAAQSRALFDGDTPFWPTRGHLFPNLSFLNAGAYTSPDQLAPFINMRLWRPIGPEVTEVWSWVLVEASAPESFKRLSRRAYVLTFGSTGTEEQDDVENFHGILRGAAGPTAAGMDQVLTMGDGLDPSVTDIDWSGPGDAVGTTYTDAGNKRFMALWRNAVLGVS